MVLWLRDRSGMTAQRHICPEGTSKVAVKPSHQVAPAGCSMSVGDQEKLRNAQEHDVVNGDSLMLLLNTQRLFAVCAVIALTAGGRSRVQRRRCWHCKCILHRIRQGTDRLRLQFNTGMTCREDLCTHHKAPRHITMLLFVWVTFLAKRCSSAIPVVLHMLYTALP